VKARAHRERAVRAGVGQVRHAVWEKALASWTRAWKCARGKGGEGLHEGKSAATLGVVAYGALPGECSEGHRRNWGRYTGRGTKGRVGA